MPGQRKLFFYKEYFKDFYSPLSVKTKNKILWTLRLIESLHHIPELYLKHLEGTNALYEIRVQYSGDIYRIFCFFDEDNLVVVGHGFEKKTQKTPAKEIACIIDEFTTKAALPRNLCPHYPTFLFASQKRKVAKEKGDFFHTAPPEKNSSTLLSFGAIQRHGAGFMPIVYPD